MYIFLWIFIITFNNFTRSIVHNNIEMIKNVTFNNKIKENETFANLYENSSILKKEIFYSVPTSDTVAEAVINILQSCFINETINLPLLLAGEYYEFLGQNRHFFDSIPVALVADYHSTYFTNFTLAKHSYILYNKYNFLWLLHKLQISVLIASSKPILRLTIQRVKDTPWFDSDGFYILIHKTKKNEDCRNALSFLMASWEFDLISSIFLCKNKDKKLQLYTYSPYSSDIPYPWKEVTRLKGRKNHPWILLNRPYNSQIDSCYLLNFDKTRQLDGYEIRANAVSIQPILTINQSKNGLDKFSGENSELWKVLWHKLNTSVLITIHNGTSYAMGGVNSNGTLNGLLADIGNGKQDMGMNSRFFVTTWKVRHTYPHVDAGICVVTKFAGYQSELTKLLTFLSPQLIIGIFILSSFTHLFLSKDQGFYEAGMNVLRLSVCVSISHPPNTNSGRLYIHTIVIFYMIINTIFQAHWQFILTIPVPKSNIDSLDDLRKSKYTIYGMSILKDLIGDAELRDRYHFASYTDCKELALNSSDAACAGDCLHWLYRIKDDDLHRSQEIRELLHTHIIRKNWSLYNRINNFIQRMVEAGLVVMWRNKGLRIYQSHVKKLVEERKEYTVLSIQQLNFIFTFLLIGYITSISVFFIELLVYRYSDNFDNKIITKKITYRKINKNGKIQKIQKTIRFRKQQVIYPWLP